MQRPNSNEQQIREFIEFTLDGRTFYIRPELLANFLHSTIPLWLRDSSAPITFPADGKDHSTDIQMMEMARIGMSSLAAALGMLPGMARDLYGPEYMIRQGEDTLPIISKWLAWFCVSQIYKQPSDIVVDEHGFIEGIRPSQFSVQPVHSSSDGDTGLTGAAQAGSTGTTASD